MNEIFTLIIHQPVFNILIVFYRLLGENLGLAIIAIALISRLILLPLSMKQLKMMKSSQEFSQKVEEIKKKFKNNKEKQQAELLKIQSEFLPAQLAGCLPMIIQFILLITINNVFTQLFTEGIEAFSKYAYSFVPTFEEGYVLHTSFLGMDLNLSAGMIGLENAGVLPYIFLILILGIAQYFSVKIMQPKKVAPTLESKGKKKNSIKDQNAADDLSETLQRTTQQTLLLFPVMIMAVSYNFAAGLGLYWASQSIFVIIQQLVLNKFRKEDKVISK